MVRLALLVDKASKRLHACKDSVSKSQKCLHYYSIMEFKVKEDLPFKLLMLYLYELNALMQLCNVGSACKTIDVVA